MINISEQKPCLLAAYFRRLLLFPKVLSAATIVAKHTSALCNACRLASSKTANPVAKRQFVQSAKEVANSTANLVKSIKVSNYFLNSYVLCAIQCTVQVRAAARYIVNVTDTCRVTPTTTHAMRNTLLKYVPDSAVKSILEQMFIYIYFIFLIIIIIFFTAVLECHSITNECNPVCALCL